MEVHMPNRRDEKIEKARTSLMISVDLLKQAKHHAVDVDRDLQDIVTDALSEYLTRHSKKPAR